MSKAKTLIQKILILGVIVVGIYMLWNFEWPTPPAISGLGFLFAGLAMWIPHCVMMKKVFGE